MRVTDFRFLRCRKSVVNHKKATDYTDYTDRKKPVVCRPKDHPNPLNPCNPWLDFTLPALPRAPDPVPTVLITLDKFAAIDTCTLMAARDGSPEGRRSGAEPGSRTCHLRHHNPASPPMTRLINTRGPLDLCHEPRTPNRNPNPHNPLQSRESAINRAKKSRRGILSSFLVILNFAA